MSHHIETSFMGTEFDGVVRADGPPPLRLPAGARNVSPLSTRLSPLWPGPESAC